MLAAIDRFQMQRGTAIGSGVVLSLAALFPNAGIDLSQITGERSMPVVEGAAKPPEFTPVAPGSYGSGAIILLTDGQRTTGPDPMDAANVSPLVVWLASAECQVTGRVFEVEAGIISPADGWQHGPREDRGDRWPVEEIGPAVDRLLAESPPQAPVYGS